MKIQVEGGAMGQAGLFDLFQPSFHEAQANLVIDARGVGRQVGALGTTLRPANSAMAWSVTQSLTWLLRSVPINFRARRLRTAWTAEIICELGQPAAAPGLASLLSKVLPASWSTPLEQTE